MKHTILVCLLYCVSFPVWSFCNENIPGKFEFRYIDNGNGTVTDNMTGLIWMRCDLGSSWDTALQACMTLDDEQGLARTWFEALDGVNDVNNSGNYSEALAFQDWRLPNIKEIASLINFYCLPEKIDKNVFPNADNVYWSSTPFYKKLAFGEKQNGLVPFYDAAYVANFHGELDVNGSAIVAKHRVRLVRGMQ